MSGSLSTRSAPDRVYRIGRDDDAWAWPDWNYAGLDGTFGNRWDDPLGVYRVLYSSRQRHGCFLEVLARFRPDPLVSAGLDAIDDDGRLPQTAPAGQVPLSWTERRCIGEADLATGVFADVGSAQSLAHLNDALAAVLAEAGLHELDGAAIRAQAPRSFTQRISAYVSKQTLPDNQLFAGIYYQSRLGDDIDNYALFEGDGRWSMERMNSSPIDRADPALRLAFETFNLTWGS